MGSRSATGAPLPSARRCTGRRRSSDHEDRRVVGDCAGMPEQRGIAHEHDRPGRGVDLLAVDREDRVPAHHGEELLVAVRLVLLVVGLVMRFDHLVAGVSGRGVDAEGLDVEMAADEVERAVVDVRVPGVDLFQGVDVGQADGAVRCGAGIAHGADTATSATLSGSPGSGDDESPDSSDYCCPRRNRAIR